MRRILLRYGGLIAVLAILLIASFLVFLRDERGGLDQAPELRRVADTGEDLGELPPPDETLRTTYRTVNLIQKHYLDPSRIDSRQMLVDAAKAIQLRVAQVIVREEGDELVVRLDSRERKYDLAGVKTPWILLQRLREVFAFVRSGVSDADVDFQDLEYATINAMLQTLDPHSALLPPDMYRDMKDKTEGEFGGLGIVISIRDGVLTIISPIDGTPADLAGLEAGDQVIKIGEASTVSMPLNDAVNLMRGKPGTSVTLWIMRKGWEEPRPFEITRAIIQVKSVESEMLSGKVGYVRIKDFQGNTASDLKDHLARLQKQGARGLVLDMRNNPGGLLKAAIKVADIFLHRGVIVTTAGQGPTDRDVRRAKDTGNEPDYPLVVLVNSGSASASEIVAGALKNHDRALVVGRRTFGKGSVQVLYDYNDGSALKMTTAQYLTPGDISIQSIGVVPHVECFPMRADEEMLDLKVVTGYREADLEHHIEEDATSTLRVGRPAATLRYLWVEEKGKGDEDGGRDLGDEEEFKPDFEIDLARDLVVEMAAEGLEKVDVERLKPVLDSRRRKEVAKLGERLARMGIDWTEGPAASGDVKLKHVVDIPGDEPLVAGQTAELVVRTTNRGAGSVHRLLATTRSDFRALDDRELAFGKVAPGQTIERRIEFKIPKDVHARLDDVLVTFDDGAGDVIPSAALRLSVEELPKPRFAYTYQLVDDIDGNGDGTLQPGEKVRLLFDIENVGEGASLETFATLKSLSGKDVFLVKGREKLEEVPPGERRVATFEFEVKPGFEGKNARFEVAIMDVDLKVYSVDKLAYPIREPVGWGDSRKGEISIGEPTRVFEAPLPDAREIAALEPGARLEVKGATADGGFTRVMLSPDRPGWIAGAAGTAVEGEADAGAVEAILMINASPDLEIEPVERVVRRPRIRIRGTATDETRVRNVYVFVGDDKAYFEPNSDPERPGEMNFDATVELEKGQNFITVVAEETPVLDTRKVITVRRDRVDGMPFVKSEDLKGKPESIGVIPEER